MTTKELIAELQRLDPAGNGNVEIPIRTYTQAYPVAYLTPGWLEHSPHHNDGVRIYVSFPEGFTVSQRKAKATTN